MAVHLSSLLSFHFLMWYQDVGGPLEFMVRGTEFCTIEKKAKILLFHGSVPLTIYPVVFSVKMTTSSFTSSVTLPLRTDKILCLAVSVGLGMDKGSSLLKLIEASLLKCLSFSPGPMASTKAFAICCISALFEHGHTVPLFSLRYSLGSVTQRSPIPFLYSSEQNVSFSFRKQTNHQKILECVCLYCIAMEITFVLLISQMMRHQLS